MSDSALKEAPLATWFDSESNLLDISSVNSTPELGVNANPILVRALRTEDSSAMGSAPNKSNPVGHAHWKRQSPAKG